MRLLAPLTTAAAALLALAPAVLGPAAAADTHEPVPVPLHTSANAIPGQYIVTLDKTADPVAVAAVAGVKPSFTYSKAMRGFAASLTAAQLKAVRVLPGVTSLEEDAALTAPPVPAVAAPAPRVAATSWGLDRIDQEQLPLDNAFTVQGNGAGVTAYILDTGIDFAHSEFGGRAKAGFDAVGDGRNGLDCHGHGTHVAGTVGGRTHGVATKVNLVSVRVLGCDGRGTYSGIIAALDWVAENAKQPAVLNGSLGGARSSAVNAAADALFDAGVLPVFAAGNEAQDACNVSPASASRAVTVAATDRYDRETDFSNFGQCVALYAPGQEIVSARLSGGSVSLDGTSMAAPHVTGVAALYKAAHPAEAPDRVAGFLEQRSTKDILTRLSYNTPNRLLNTAGY
ncbi:S8 family peptidase [Streptomyces sp. BR123]|uniref:S8 family peptidase n=1 Tax=Streptomyces sp. BR123 TaxID=2749828 RepID=UPI0015C4CC4E|nr:S8 family peptidase [Streptomyces sp. BR123]NXY98884.1 S8 family peptidase [Streptomyces sp. BR123]